MTQSAVRPAMGEKMRSTSALLVVVLLTSSVLLVVAPAGTAEDRAAGDWVQASTGLPTSGTYFGVAFGDVNNDGKLDIVAASDGSGVGVYLGDAAAVQVPRLLGEMGPERLLTRRRS